jgi:RNA polymerase sigma-70 factor (ECF subfamily)
MDDEALLDRARRGDREAFTDLVVRHQDELYTMALRYTGRPSDAADVVQETFLRAFLNVPKLRGASIRPWLHRVALNAARDLHRRNARRPADPMEDAEGKVLELPDPGAGPEVRAENRERAGAIRSALLELPDEFRSAVVLRDVSDLTYEEIAETLRLPLGTVKSRISRGRTLLAAALRRSEVLFPAAGGEL